jgi:hypothetical protein
MVVRFGSPRSLGLLASCAFAGPFACQALAADPTALPLGTGGDKGAQDASKPKHSWDLPALTIQGQPQSTTKDDDLVGDYGQPRWTTTRRFTEVRTYVLPAGQLDFEYWLFDTLPSDNELKQAEAAGAQRPKPSLLQQYEVEMGLGHRIQLDIYQVTQKDGTNNGQHSSGLDGTGGLNATKFEIRYALADWGKIWGNPTLYSEWIEAVEGADSWENKLLLCDDFNNKWSWATNFVFQELLGDTRDRSHEWNSAISYDAIDEKLEVGFETNFAYVNNLIDPASSHREHHWELSAGPSIRLYPVAHAHVILAEFVGLNKDAPESKTVAIFGWEF